MSTDSSITFLRLPWFHLAGSDSAEGRHPHLQSIWQDHSCCLTWLIKMNPRGHTLYSALESLFKNTFHHTHWLLLYGKGANPVHMWISASETKKKYIHIDTTFLWLLWSEAPAILSSFMPSQMSWRINEQGLAWVEWIHYSQNLWSNKADSCSAAGCRILTKTTPMIFFGCLNLDPCNTASVALSSCTQGLALELCFEIPQINPSRFQIRLVFAVASQMFCNYSFYCPLVHVFQRGYKCITSHGF